VAVGTIATMPDGSPDRFDPGRNNRRALAATAVLALVSVGFQIRKSTHSTAIGIAATAAIVALVVALMVWIRHKAEAKLATLSYGTALEADAVLDFDCLPGDWPTLARETLGGVAAQGAFGLSVKLRTDGRYVLVDKRHVLGGSKIPFHARVPLATIQRIHVAPARLSLVGSSLTFQLASGTNLAVDVPVGRERAEQVAQRFEEAVRTAANLHAESGGIEVTSPPPPPRTSQRDARVLFIASLPPFGIAMIGGQDGGFADVATTGTMFLVIALMLRRPVSTPRIIARALTIVAIAFIVDALRTGQPLRLSGAVVSLATAAWISNRPPRHTDPT
jgi:hypothetical protein